VSSKRRPKKEPAAADPAGVEAAADEAARAERARLIHDQIDALRHDAAAGIAPPPDPRRPATPAPRKKRPDTT
jgi:hypothetical protein